MTTAHDVSVVRDRSGLHIVIPETNEARDWLEANTSALYASGGVIVEPRYVVGLLLGMAEDGFSVPLEKRQPDEAH